MFFGSRKKLFEEERITKLIELIDPKYYFMRQEVKWYMDMNYPSENIVKIIKEKYCK